MKLSGILHCINLRSAVDRSNDLWQKNILRVTCSLVGNHDIMKKQTDVVCLSFQLTAHIPATKRGPTLENALDALVEKLSKRGIMADYKCRDYLGRDLVPLETAKRYWPYIDPTG